MLEQGLGSREEGGEGKDVVARGGFGRGQPLDLGVLVELGTIPPVRAGGECRRRKMGEREEEENGEEPRSLHPRG